MTDTETNAKNGGLRKLFIWFFIVIPLSITVVFLTFGQSIPPNHIGIRQSYFSVGGLLEEGFSSKGLQPGLHLVIPGLSKIHLIPRDFQLVHLNDKIQNGDYDLPPLLVPTTDGAKVKTDATLVVRFFEKREGGPEIKLSKESIAPQPCETVPFASSSISKHGGPRELVVEYTLDKTTQLDKFSQIAGDKLRETLSELSTTDFYNPCLREPAALKAVELINKEAKPAGIDLWASLIRRYVYAEENIDNQIFAKILQEQTERLNAADKRLKTVQAKTAKVAAEGDARIKDLQVEGEAEVDILRSEGELYEAEQKAKGDLLVAEAKANVDKEKAKVLAEIKGSDIYIARELAPIVSTLEGGIVSDLDPYDVNTWVKKLTGK